MKNCNPLFNGRKTVGASSKVMMGIIEIIELMNLAYHHISQLELISYWIILTDLFPVHAQNPKNIALTYEQPQNKVSCLIKNISLFLCVLFDV